MKRLILEVSLKPFRDLSERGMRVTVGEVLRQWQSLIRDAESLSFLLWTAEGSEILEYNGDKEAEIDWARWIGIANGPWTKEPQVLHTWRWPYCENPARLTYGRLAEIVRILKEEGERIAGKPVTVGSIFDPGPEFAESAFKYVRHKEISRGETMGEGKWVGCSAILDGDSRPYAGFPDGIPDKTPLGVFLGRQSQRFLTDLGFDYIWFSNGFGFALAAWNVTGEVFDGSRFDTAGAVRVREAILRFWTDFRKECPRFPIETRGSNLSTGMDLSAHASPVREIYRGGFDLVAPVNSPWAALNGDYGLELIGWLSHIAELPDGRPTVPFRFYIHDPWWANSPWIDRYGGEPNDIYLPLSVCRIDGEGAVTPPGSVSLLTLDDSYGRMPERVPNEVTPHLQQALRDFPDAPGPVTWIYPFDEYHEWAFGGTNRVDEVFFGDWFMRAAVNQGFPLNTAVSTANYAKASVKNPDCFAQTLLVSPAPETGSALVGLLLEHLGRGGDLLLYGPLRHADPRLLSLLGLEIGAPISGALRFRSALPSDALLSGAFAEELLVREITSGGGVEEVFLDRAASGAMAEVATGGETRAFAVFIPVPGGGRLGWVRGALAEEITKEELPKRDDPRRWFSSARLMRAMLEKFGSVLRFEKPTVETVDPLVLAARARNGWFFSGFTPSTNVRLRWRFPEGVPVPVGCDVLMEECGEGLGTMSLPKAWHRECRVFVSQTRGGEVSCREKHAGAVGVHRRLAVTGLKDADVVFLHDTDFSTPVRFQEDGGYLGLGKEIPSVSGVRSTVARGVTGNLLITW